MNRFTGTGHLVRLALRRDRIRIPLWVVTLAAITYASGNAVAGLYPDQERIDGYARLVGTSPLTVAFSGPPVGLDTLAGIVVYEVSFTVILGAAIMAVTMMTRHTRAEEESGRSEMLRATEVGRHAGAAAALVTTTGTCLLLGGALGVALTPTALSGRDAAVFGAAVASLGIVYAAVTLCLAQLFVHSRTATGAGLLVFGIGYVLRAAGDVREDWLVWLSPIGWAQATRVPTDSRLWPLLLPVLATLLLLALAVLLADRRDFGGGLLPSLPGRATAPPTLTGTLGLTWRIQRGAVIGWSVAMLAFALITGSLGSSMQDMIDSNPALADYLELASGVSVLDSYIATMVLILGLGVGSFAVWSAGHRGPEEDGGQLELVLAGPLGRVRVTVEHLLVSAAATTAVLLVTAVGVGVSHGLVTSDAAEGWRAFGAQLAYLPAILTLIGLVALFDGWLPRWTWVGWVALALAFLVGWLGGLLDPPRWVVELSVFSHTPRVPIESAWDLELLVLVLCALALMAAGVVGFRRRDVGVG